MESLPTHQQLETLTLRAIVAYAVRSARRAGEMLRGVLGAELVETPMHVAERLVSVRHLNLSDGPGAASAAAAVAKAMPRLATPELKVAALSLMDMAMATVAVYRAMGDTRRTEHQAEYAARKAADCAARAVEALSWHDGSTSAVSAALLDYKILLRNFGKRAGILLGEPIDLSDEWWETEALR